MLIRDVLTGQGRRGWIPRVPVGKSSELPIRSAEGGWLGWPHWDVTCMAADSMQLHRGVVRWAEQGSQNAALSELPRGDTQAGVCVNHAQSEHERAMRVVVVTLKRQGLEGYKPTFTAKEGNKLGEENYGAKGKGAYRKVVNTATCAKGGRSQKLSLKGGAGGGRVANEGSRWVRG
ncbi:hypothetical protein HaLaN_11829 [Haematococcus lacustris]|uniref:Uncharacterized protein n=1 Tax=Haematococcus lacustris TaxID=44745 RepID=A0A699Z1R2_HAELA|nr:hypothetical protein HaLaN_11829 [Haematococcus lacustris]